MIITVKQFKKYENQWVAIDEKTGEVVASAKDVEIAQKEAEKKMIKDAHITLRYIEPLNAYLAPVVI